MTNYDPDGTAILVNKDYYRENRKPPTIRDDHAIIGGVEYAPITIEDGQKQCIWFEPVRKAK